MPGRQIYTPVIDQIDPYVTCGYRNVVVHCAINDLKKDDVKNIANMFFLFMLIKLSAYKLLTPKLMYIYVPLSPLNVLS